MFCFWGSISQILSQNYTTFHNISDLDFFLVNKFHKMLPISHNISQYFSPGSAGCEVSYSEAGSCSGGSWSADSDDSDLESELESVSEYSSLSKVAAPPANWPGQPEPPDSEPPPPRPNQDWQLYKEICCVIFTHDISTFHIFHIFAKVSIIAHISQYCTFFWTAPVCRWRQATQRARRRSEIYAIRGLIRSERSAIKT